MHVTTLLDLIAEREAATTATATQLRDQISALTTELAHADAELARLATTRTTIQDLTADQFTDDDPTIASAPYQQILTILAEHPAGMRAKDICLAVGVEPSPKHVEGARARLKRLVSREVLIEAEPGVFILV